MAPQPGQRLSENIVLEREIGVGAMGSVWLARNVALGSHVAVKLLHGPAGLVSDELLRRFAQEARALAQLEHPHIVRVFDFGTSPQHDPFIVMELLRGEDLDTRLARVTTLDLATTSEIVTQVSRALTRAASAGVVHRDLKPANVFLLEGDAIFVKVLDFGVAKLAGREGMTRAGALIGTPLFMSPEQFAGGKIDHRSDLWSLAVVVYRCLTGALPFQGTSPVAIAIAIDSGELLPPSRLRPDLPPALDGLMRKALAIDPATRFQSASELASALAAIAQPATRSPAHPLESAATVYAPLPSVRPKGPRGWWIVAAGAALGALAIGWALWVKAGRPTETDSEETVVGTPAASRSSSSNAERRAAVPPAGPATASLLAYDPDACIVATRRALAGKVRGVELRFYSTHAEIDVRSAADVAAVHRYSCRGGAVTRDPEQVDEHGETAAELDPLSFGLDELGSSAIATSARDASTRVKLERPTLTVITVSRAAEEPRPEISVVVEDAAERTAVVEYDASGKLLRLHAE